MDMPIPDEVPGDLKLSGPFQPFSQNRREPRQDLCSQPHAFDLARIMNPVLINAAHAKRDKRELGDV
jgi:hypothetical protein